MKPTTRSSRWAAALERRAGWVLGVAALLTAVLAVPFLTMAPTGTASQEPAGAVFEARDAIDERFVSNVYEVPIVIESDDGNVLDRAALLEIKASSDALRTDPLLGPDLFEYYDADAAVEVRGFFTIADLVDSRVPGGLAAATDAQVDAVVAALVSEYGDASPTLGLSVQAAYDETSGTWTSPAVFSPVLGNNDLLGLGSQSITLGADTDGEQWARSIVEALREGAAETSVLGVAIDVNLTSEEQGQAAGPFIGFTILAVLLIVGLTFRSYWVLTVTGVALGALIVWLKGITHLVGFEDDLVLSLVVPVAMISFGVDFTFHAVGRYREERAAGLPPRRAFVTGLAGVAGALGLALASDAAAFLANVSSGIESIVQFGVGAAVALGAAYLLLGVVTPLAVSRIEDRLGDPRPGRLAAARRIAAASLSASFAMAAVLLMVYVLPVAGVAALAVYALAFLALPTWRARPAPTAAAAVPAVSGGSSRLVGSFIGRIAAARLVVIPAVLIVTGVAAVLATRVPTEFDVKDFFAADTDFVRSLDALDEHVGDRGGEPALVYVEAPLTDPDVVARLDAFSTELAAMDAAGFGRSQDGTITVDGGTSAVLDQIWASPIAAAAVESATGVAITDADGDGVPDTPPQLAALWDYTRRAGVPLDAERLLLTPGDVRTAVWVGDEGSATVFELALTDTRRQEAIGEARDALAGPIDGLRADLAALSGGDVVVEATGSPIARQASLEGVSRALQISLPIAVVLCLVIAAVAMRSTRLGLVSVVPILMTVSWLYAAMELFGYSINLVTATIGAVSIGIGIDFAVHFTMRYREELAATGDRLSAVRAAGEGTGTALIASAASSAVGFAIMALAPMPLFASYGLLTALMIVMAAGATLLVLPGLLVLVTADAPAKVAVARPVDPQPEPARA